MFNHQYNFDIEIPKELITKVKHDSIFEELLENKVVIGLCGYGKSGKDFLAKKFIDNYGFHRVAFADNIKIEMNENIKEAVFMDIHNQKWGSEPASYKGEVATVETHPFHLEDDRVLIMEMMDFQTEDIPLKKVLRPYIIWYGEKMREINGQSYWINQAFKIDAAGHDKIILSDVRRLKELDPFKNSNTHIRRTRELFTKAGCLNKSPEIKAKSFTSLLFHVSQLGLTDTDVLTHDCIRVAQEQWLFDETIYVDPRMPEEDDYRETISSMQVFDIAYRYGISKPDKTISPRQTKMFN